LYGGGGTGSLAQYINPPESSKRTMTLISWSKKERWLDREQVKHFIANVVCSMSYFMMLSVGELCGYTTCSLLKVTQHFRGTCCLHLQG
jgi:hypothetical protein